jgi:hypothetical protein
MNYHQRTSYRIQENHHLLLSILGNMICRYIIACSVYNYSCMHDHGILYAIASLKSGSIQHLLRYTYAWQRMSSHTMKHSEILFYVWKSLWYGQWVTCIPAGPQTLSLAEIAYFMNHNLRIMKACLQWCR